MASCRVRLMLHNAMVPVSGGLAVGLVAAIPFARLLRSFLFQVAPTSPATFAGAAVVLLFGALAAAYVPARRATRIDPLAALRSE